MDIKEMHMNNRRYERYSYETPVVVYPEKNPERSYYGYSHDYSKGGMYLNTDGDLEADETYVIKMINHDKSSTGPNQYEQYHGIIRWAEIPSKYSDRENSYYYGYGFAYPEPVMYKPNV